MSDTSVDGVEFSLKVMVNRKERKVLFAEADSSFADVLLNFLTLPLGTIAKVLKKHYGDEGPTFGSLTTLYQGLENLDNSHFNGKSFLLHPGSSSDAQHKGLKLDISDSSLLEYFHCEKKKPDGIFLKTTVSFLITDDLRILPNTGLSQMVDILGGININMDEVESKNVTFGFSKVMDLLKALFISSTPLSDIILEKGGERRECAERTSSKHQTETASIPSASKMMNLKVMLQQSTGKFLYAEAEEDFAEFLFGFLIITLGGAERFLGANSLTKSVENLYKSAADLIQVKYFKNPDSKNRLINLMRPHGYNKNHIFAHTQKCLPSDKYIYWNYLSGPRTYKVTDDLNVTPFSILSILSYLGEKKIPVSDVAEVKMQIGLKEGLSILKASLTSSYALSDALFNDTFNKHPKTEVFNHTFNQC